MKFVSTVAVALALFTLNASAIPVRRQLGAGFVTEACTTDADCQQGCCAFSTGKCAGPDVAQSNGDGGCGFGDAAPNCDVAKALGFNNCIAGAQPGKLSQSQIFTAATFVAQLDGLPPPSAPASSGSNNAASGGAATSSSSSSSSSAPLGQQFVTGACTSDADCQQGCCAFTTGKCAGPDVAQTNADGGCGFGQPAPNCQVASALGLSGCVAGGSPNGVLSQSQLTQAVQFVSKLDNIPLPAAFQ